MRVHRRGRGRPLQSGARAYLGWELAEILRANRQSGLNFNASHVMPDKM